MELDRLFISVIIPVRNGAQTLESCLMSIQAQQGIVIEEVLVLDSGSSDRSREIANGLGARVVSVNPSDFDHGLTRNFGASLVNSPLIYFTVQDAEIASPTMLHDMAMHFRDSAVQGVMGIQGIPENNYTNPVYWFRRYTAPTPEYRHFKPTEFNSLTPQQQFNASSWDNVNAMYRKSALEFIPFRQTKFSEDWLWARDALAAGMKLVRDSSLLTWHYHHQHFSYIARSQYIMSYYFNRFYGVKPSYPSLVYELVRRNWIIYKRSMSFSRKLYWSLHNLSSLLGHFLSVLLFRSLLFLGKTKGIALGYRWLCSDIPQGSIGSKSN